MFLLGIAVHGPIANRRGWRISTADISSGFLYGELHVPIYMTKSDGTIVKLLKSLYGSKQAAHKFKDRLNNFLSAIGFKRLCSDYILVITMEEKF